MAIVFYRLSWFFKWWLLYIWVISSKIFVKMEAFLVSQIAKIFLQVAEYFLSWASLQSTIIYPTRLHLSRCEFCLVLVNITIRLQFKNHDKTPKTFCTMPILLKMELFWFRIHVISSSQKRGDFSKNVITAKVFNGFWWNFNQT